MAHDINQSLLDDLSSENDCCLPTYRPMSTVGKVKVCRYSLIILKAVEVLNPFVESVFLHRNLGTPASQLTWSPRGPRHHLAREL